MFEDLPDVMNGKTVAKVLGCNYITVLNMAKRGELPHYRVGSLRLFRKTDIVAFVENQIAQSTKKTEDKEPELATK